MIHILFSHSASATLKYTLKKSSQKKEPIISFGEIFSVGPIFHLESETGLEARFNWMKKIMSEEFDIYHEYKQGYLEAINQVKCIPEDKPVFIWIWDNASEQTGLRYVLYLLKDKRNKIKIINTTKILEKDFVQPNIQYVMKSTGEIPPEKFPIIYEEAKECRPLERYEKYHLEEEWMNLAESTDILRIWINDEIQNVSEEYYDQYIIDIAKKLHGLKNTSEYIKAARLIGEVMGNLEQQIGDEFLEYRLKKLIDKGVFEVVGSMEAMRLYSIKLRNNL